MNLPGTPARCPDVRVRCVDRNTDAVAGPGTGSIFTKPCRADNSTQLWSRNQVGTSSDGYQVVQLRNLATDLCVKTYGDLTANPRAWAGSCPFQSTYWRAKGSSYNDFQMTYEFRHSVCLDSNTAGAAYLLECNGGLNQRWRLGL